MRLFVAVRDAARRHRVAIVIVGSIAAAAAIVAALAGKRHEFSTALAACSVPILIATTALQALALVSRTEAWHLSIEAALEATDRGGLALSTLADVRAIDAWARDFSLETIRTLPSS